MSDEMMDYAQLCAEYKLRPGTAHWLVHKRKIPFVRLGKRLVRFRRAQIETWIREREVTAADVAGGGETMSGAEGEKK